MSLLREGRPLVCAHCLRLRADASCSIGWLVTGPFSVITKARTSLMDLLDKE